LTDEDARSIEVDDPDRDIWRNLLGERSDVIDKRCWQMQSTDNGRWPGWGREVRLRRSGLRLEDCLREQGDESITARFSRTLHFDDVLTIASPNNKIWTDPSNVWLG
jgi:hypothetical protein